jgi:hypothetical protein
LVQLTTTNTMKIHVAFLAALLLVALSTAMGEVRFAVGKVLKCWICPILTNSSLSSVLFT